MMARCLLVNPPFYRIWGSHYNGMSLGLSYIASSLNAAGHDAWVYNADYCDDERYKTLHQIFEDFDHSHLDFTLSNPCLRDAVNRIVEFDPDFVGYTCYTALVPVVALLTREVRKAVPGVKQVVGGPHAALDANTRRLIPDADFVVQGEGEAVMRNIVDGSAGESGTISASRITDLDSLPFPERVKFWPQSERPLDVAYLSTARGCPWRCAYCASPNIWPRVFCRSPANVLTEITGVTRCHLGPQDGGSVETQGEVGANGKLKIRDNASLYIIDDTFTFNKRRAIEIMRGLEIPWKCEARADTITEEIAQAMAGSGCVRAKIGVESGSERILRAINKGETKDDMRRGISLLQKHGVPVTIYLMAGFPDETDDDLRQTIAFARELRPDYCSISMVAPYYGTRLYKDALASGLPVDRAPWECFFHQHNSGLLNNRLSRDLVEELWGLCDIQNYK